MAEGSLRDAVSLSGAGRAYCGRYDSGNGSPRSCGAFGSDDALERLVARFPIRIGGTPRDMGLVHTFQEGRA